MTEAYNAFFAGCEGPMPVRNYIGTTGFQAAKERKQLVQIDCIAHVE